MKRPASLLLVAIMLCSLTACGVQQTDTTTVSMQEQNKNEDVKNVERLIDGIGEVTLEKEKYITDAEIAYAQLYEVDKASVENYNQLISARDTYNTLLEERNIEIEAMIDEAYKDASVFDFKTAQGVLQDAKNLVVTEKQLSAIDDAQELFSAMLYEGSFVVRLEQIYAFTNEYEVHEKTDTAESVYTYTFDTNNSTAGDYSNSLSAYKEYMDKHFSLVSTTYDALHAADVYSYSSEDGETISVTRYAVGYPVIGYFVITISK